jgi:hypothetical protein
MSHAFSIPITAAGIRQSSLPQMKKTSIVFITILLTLNAYSQFIASPTGDDNSIIELVKKEDFSSLSIVLNNEGFKATTQNYNYDGGTNRVIADLFISRNLGSIYRQLTYMGSDLSHWIDVSEDISINYIDEGNCKRLKYTHTYTTDAPFNFLSILKYCSQKPLTYVCEPKKVLDKDSMRFSGYSFAKWDDSVIAKREEGLNESDRNKLMRIWDTQPIVDSGHHYIFYHKNIFDNDLGIIYTTNTYEVSFGSIYQNKADAKKWYSILFSLEEIYPIDNNLINIPLTKEGNLYYFYLKVGSSSKKYLFDSGASYISISEEDYQELAQSGLIYSKPRLKQFILADGSTVLKRCIVIPKLKIGKATLKNINAMIVKDGEPLLFGESVLNQFKSWQLNTVSNELSIEAK